MARSGAAAGRPATRSWRTVDVVVVGVLAVALGVVQYVWNQLYGTLAAPFGATPFIALVNGVWLIPGVLGMLVVRKPGAAVLTSTLAALFAAFMGSVWGLSVVYYGFFQGLAPELVFLLLAYRRFGLPAALLSGAATGAAVAVLDRLIAYPGVSAGFTVVYSLCCLATGIVVAGLGSWAATRSLAATGALAPFASGRQRAAV